MPMDFYSPSAQRIARMKKSIKLSNMKERENQEDFISQRGRYPRVHRITIKGTKRLDPI